MRFKNIEIEIMEDKEITLLIRDFKRMMKPRNLLGIIYVGILFVLVYSFIITFQEINFNFNVEWKALYYQGAFQGFN